MSDVAKPVVFSVSRHDLLYNFADTLDEVFKFAPNAAVEPTSEPGVHLQEDEGFDFAFECKPTIIIQPCAELLAEEIDTDPEDLTIHVSLEDLGLGIREIILELPVSEVISPEERIFDLQTFPDMAFVQGFEVRCFITRRSSVAEGADPIWHKSQIIFERSFSCRTSTEDGLFQISWITFQDKRDADNLLYYVDWLDYDVSNLEPHNCFIVAANEALRLQYKRLENNSHFGHFTVRLIAQDILQNIVGNCLRFADLKTEPAPDSLHATVEGLLERLDINFQDHARKIQSKESIKSLNAQTELNRLLQREHLIGSTLTGILFGGYRG